MPLYRTLERLSGGDGTVYEMDIVSPLRGIKPKVIAILLEKRRITEVQAPPLRILPGWKKKAEALEVLGIEDVSQLVTADFDKVAKELDVSVENLRSAAEDAQQWVEL